MLTSRPAAPAEPSGVDRRAFPRLAVDLPVRVVSAEHVSDGRTVDASERGLLVDLAEPFTMLARRVQVEVELPNEGWTGIEADVVRREAVSEGRVLVALRLHDPEAETEAPRPRKRRSRAKPKPPRPREVVEAELRGLGGLAYEQALLAPEAEPSESIIAWVNALAAELGEGPIPMAATNRGLMGELVRLHRRLAARGAEGGR
jgi:hypothetical protein